MNQPIKSTNDKKEYRLITLPNGLKCLLVSDLNDLTSNEDDNDSESSYNDETASNESECGTDSIDISDDEEDETESTKSKTKSRMQNKDGSNPPSNFSTISVAASYVCGYYVADYVDHDSAACMVVNAGSYNDPKDIPGLAHFIEHMVFMGSEKYPIENDFDSFLNKHGGDSNAHTLKEQTYFYFEVECKHFFTALDIFANFFISPLMKEDSIDREIEAVDSEFKIDSMSDDIRREQLIASMALPEHPVSNFSWGNALTLKTRVKEQDINLYSRAKQFKEKYYTSQSMQLVVVSKESLDMLEQQVLQIFSDIKNNQMDITSTNTIDNMPFNNESFNKFYKVESIKEMDDLYLLWCLPSNRKHYKEKPLCYLSSLIGHEGEGSLYSALKNRHWATYLEGGSSGIAADTDTYWTEFSIHIELTPDGHANIDQVITMVFQYIKMLQSEIPSEDYYNEISHIAHSVFSYKEVPDVVEYAELLASGMSRYIDEDIITGDYLYFKFDAELISSYQNLLRSSNVNLMLMSKRDCDRCTLVEPWFNTKYCVDEITPNLKDKIASVRLNKEFHYPHKNILVATNFQLKDMLKEYKIPVQIVDNAQGIFFYCNNSKFKVPKGAVNILLENNLIRSSDKNSCLADIYLNTLLYNLTEVGYQAMHAQLEYNISVSAYGLLISISGFDHKISNLMQIIIKYITKFTFTPELWQSMVSKLRKDYSNEYMNQEQVARTTRLSVLEHDHRGFHLRMVALEKLSMGDLEYFARKLISPVYVQCLIQGNFGKWEATGIYSNLITTLGCCAMRKSTLIDQTCLRLPVGNNIVESYSCGEDNNCMIINYYQLAPEKLKSYALNELLMLVMREPLFDKLRTQKQLGYSVYNNAHYSYGVIGFSITVCSQIDQFSMQDLDNHIEDFLKHLLEEIQEMSALDFSTINNSLIKTLSCDDTHMDEAINRNWNIVYGKSRNFNFIKKQIEFLKNFTPKDLEKRMLAYMNPKIRRKLSVLQSTTPKIHGDNEIVKNIPEGEGEHPEISLKEFKQSNDFYEFSKIY